MKNDLILGVAGLALFAAACGGDTRARTGQVQYETVQEGAASGVTTTIHGPGETLPPITGTNADTTSAFTLDPTAIAGTPAAPGGTLATTLPPTTVPPTVNVSDRRPAAATPPPASQPRQAYVPQYEPPQQARPVESERPVPTETAEPAEQPAEPADSAEPSTNTAPAPPADTDTAPAESEDEPAEEPPPPPPPA
jgi:hypothetical protein